MKIHKVVNHTAGLALGLFCLLFAQHCITAAKSKYKNATQGADSPTVQNQKSLSPAEIRLGMPSTSVIACCGILTYTLRDDDATGSLPEPTSRRSKQVMAFAKILREQGMDMAIPISEISAGTTKYVERKDAHRGSPRYMNIFYKRVDSGWSRMLSYFSLGLIPAYQTTELYLEMDFVKAGVLHAQAKYTAEIKTLEGAFFNPIVLFGKIFYSSTEIEMDSALRSISKNMLQDYARIDFSSSKDDDQKIIHGVSYRIHDIRSGSIILALRPGLKVPHTGQVVQFTDTNGNSIGQGKISEVFHTKVIVKHISGLAIKGGQAQVQ